MTLDEIKKKIGELLGEIGELDPAEIDDAAALIGSRAVIKSRALVELLLALEEYAEDELNVVFDWTSDAAMSESRSIFRTVSVLAEHLHGLSQAR